MIVVMELLALIAAVVVAVAGVASNSGSTQPLSDNFVIPGQRLNGLSTRQPVSYGIAVRPVVLLGPGNPETPTRACPDRGGDRQQFGHDHHRRAAAQRSAWRTIGSNASRGGEI
jgi:hypothetical protein